jgi:predicted DNA-binding protein
MICTVARKAFLGFRLHPEVKKRLEEIASREERSLSQVCEIILRKGTEDYVREGPKYFQRIISREGKKDSQR